MKQAERWNGLRGGRGRCSQEAGGNDLCPSKSRRVISGLEHVCLEEIQTHLLFHRDQNFPKYFLYRFLVLWYTGGCQEVPLEICNCYKHWLTAERLGVKTIGCQVTCGVTEVSRSLQLWTAMLSTWATGVGIEYRCLHPCHPLAPWVEQPQEYVTLKSMKAKASMLSSNWVTG